MYRVLSGALDREHSSTTSVPSFPPNPTSHPLVIRDSFFWFIFRSDLDRCLGESHCLREEQGEG